MTTHDSKHHALSPTLLLGTWIALVILTVVTVAVSRIDLGSMNTVVALGVATLKATLVAAIFMHLKYGSRFLVLCFGTSVAMVILMAGFVLFDTHETQPSINARRAAEAAAQAKLKK